MTTEAIKTLTIERVFSAPRKLVFDAWIEVKHFQEWWMPRGFTNPVCKFTNTKTPGRAEVGSGIVVTSYHPDFGEMPMAGTFEEINPIDRIVFTSEAFPDTNGIMQLVDRNTITFADEPGAKTRVVLHAAVLKALPEHAAALDGMEQGWSETIDRLAEHVEDTSDREMSIDRLVDAPRELVWKVWTEPEHVREWWGPNGFTNTIHKMDLTPGGEWLLTMHGPDGTDYPNHIRFIEIIPSERLIYDHGQPEDGGQFRSFVRFTDEGGKTRVSMKGVFKTAEYRQMVIDKYGALEGQKQHMARMEEYITKIKHAGETR
jgi:uncharacterized protein YndB with AHSA1/START domain